MRLRRALAVPALATVAVSAAIVFGGCGSSSSADTTKATPAADTTAKEDAAMKHESGAMKDESKAMKDER